MKFTILGASGFIGAHLLAQLEASGYECFAPARDDGAVFGRELGHVIYCIGLTADFRQRPFDTVRAHICFLAEVLEKANFESLLYLSSTRVYVGAASGGEDAPLVAGDLYNLSKLAGESLCLASGRANVRVARLSNVFGGDFFSDNFLPSILRAAVRDGRVVLNTALGAAKDYVALEDVVKILPLIALQGKQGIYNVAGGTNVSNVALLEKLAQFTGCTYTVDKNAPAAFFPTIAIGKLQKEFDFKPLSLLGELEKLVQQAINLRSAF